MNGGYLNSAAKWGLFLGVVLSLSRIYESKVLISGDMVQFSLFTLEWIAVLLLYVYIAYRANKEQAVVVDPKDGYPFRRALNFTILISAFAGIIVGVSSHIYVVKVIGGYDAYALKSVESILSVLKEANVDGELRELYESSLESVKSMGEDAPNIFSTTLSMVANYIISGFVVGLIVAFFTKRAPESPQIINDSVDE